MTIHQINQIIHILDEISKKVDKLGILFSSTLFIYLIIQFINFVNIVLKYVKAQHLKKET